MLCGLENQEGNPRLMNVSPMTPGGSSRPNVGFGVRFWKAAALIYGGAVELEASTSCVAADPLPTSEWPASRRHRETMHALLLYVYAALHAADHRPLAVSALVRIATRVDSSNRAESILVR